MKKEVIFARTLLVLTFLYSYFVLSQSLHIRHQKTRDKVGNRADKEKSPPIYLTRLFDHFAKDENKGKRGALQDLDGIEIPSSTLFRAFLPAKYSDKENGEVVSKRVEFQKLNISKIMNHSSVHLVLTAKDRVIVNEGSHLNMILLQPNGGKFFETKMSYKILPGGKFCVIDITKLVGKYARVYGASKGKLRLIFEFTLYKNYRRKHGVFEEYFRTDNNGPFILFNFKNTKDSENKENIKVVTETRGSGELSRKRRSAHPVSVLKNNETQLTTNKTSSMIYSDELPVNRSLKGEVVLNITFVSPLTPPFEIEKKGSSLVQTGQIEMNDIDTNDGRDILTTTLGVKKQATAQPTLASSKGPLLNSPLKTVCRRHEWLVSPENLNWPNVYHPKLLDLGLCIGGCPFPLLNDHFNFTLHSFFVDQNRLINGVGHIANYPESHCVGIKYKSLDVMLVDPEDPNMNFETKRYYDISVDTCGCR